MTRTTHHHHHHSLFLLPRLFFLCRSQEVALTAHNFRAFRLLVGTAWMTNNNNNNNNWSVDEEALLLENRADGHGGIYVMINQFATTATRNEAPVFPEEAHRCSKDGAFDLL